MYIFIYISMYILKDIYVYTYKCTCTYCGNKKKLSYFYICIYVYTCTYIYTCIYMYTRVLVTFVFWTSSTLTHEGRGGLHKLSPQRMALAPAVDKGRRLLPSLIQVVEDGYRLLPQNLNF